MDVCVHGTIDLM